MFRSATLRLTLSYLTIVMAISLVFSALLYNETTRDLSQGLRSESQSIFSQYPIFQNDPSLNLQPTHYYRAEAHRILIRLIGFNLIVLVVAGFSSYWLAEKTLEPIIAAHDRQRRFTSDVSHELRTPLTAIKMESEVALLSTKTPTSELKQTIKSNLEEVAKLETLINNLLKLSRLETTDLKANFKAVNAKDMVEQAVKKLESKSSNHHVLIDVPDKLTLYGDSDSLEQLTIILLDNALKYSPKDSKINIKAYLHNHQTILEVEDNGYGISPNNLENIFDRFYRVDNSRNKGQESEGYGLGLSIAQMIADLHDAEITITSQVSQGTSVKVRFPSSKT